MTGHAHDQLTPAPVTSRLAVRAGFGAVAVAAGLAAAWLPSAHQHPGGPAVVLAGLGVLLAAGNGYGKAYSP
jgi:hypothetical protein